MIKRFIRRVFGPGSPRAEARAAGAPRVTRNSISSSALKVCDVLADRGYAAYVVGGAVRRHPARPSSPRIFFFDVRPTMRGPSRSSPLFSADALGDIAGASAAGPRHAR
jgi:hypothetical protein